MVIVSLPCGSLENNQTTVGERIYLYNYGDECADITGGWLSDSHAFSTISESAIITLEKNVNNLHMYLMTPSSPKINAIFYTSNTIDLTEYSKIGIKYKCNDENSTSDKVVGNIYPSNWYEVMNYQIPNDPIAKLDKSDAEIEIINDLASKPTDKHMAIRMDSGSVNVPSEIYIYQIWLEKDVVI